MTRTQTARRKKVSVYQLQSSAKLMTLRVDDPNLRRHPIAQRTKRNKNHVDSIVANYNPMIDMPIVVSYRNKWKNIVDGDHRYAARKKMNENGECYPYIDAIVYFGLTLKQEHALFYGLNQKKKQLDSFSKWFNGYHGGEKEIVEPLNLVARMGYSCDIGPNDDTNIITKHSEYDWRGDECIGTLVSLYKRCPHACEHWLHGIQSWRVKTGSLHPTTMTTEVLKGSFHFVKRYCMDLEVTQVQKLFRRTNPAKVLQLVTQLQIKKGKCRGDGQVVEAFARATGCYRKNGKVVVKG